MTYLEWRRRQALHNGEGYGDTHIDEPAAPVGEVLPPAFVAILPLIAVAALNRVFTSWIPQAFGSRFDFADHGIRTPVAAIDVPSVAALWAVQCALVTGILLIVVLAWKRVRTGFQSASGAAVGGAMLAALNTGSEYGFGAVIALLPGFRAVTDFLSRTIQDTLLNVAVTTNVLAAITGLASRRLQHCAGLYGPAYSIGRSQPDPAEVLHRVAAMASGGMDTLPHNGAVITVLAITGLSSPGFLRRYLRNDDLQSRRGCLRDRPVPNLGNLLS